MTPPHTPTDADKVALISRIEQRLAKIPEDLSGSSIRGAGLQLLVADLRWLVAELKAERAIVRVLRDFRKITERFSQMAEPKL